MKDTGTRMRTDTGEGRVPFARRDGPTAAPVLDGRARARW